VQHIASKASFRLLLLAFILIAGAVLRVGESRSLPFWMDEAYSFWFSGLSWTYLWTEVPKFENHPPAYFLLLKAWREIAGASEFALRIPSILASLGSVVALFVAGRAMGETLTTGPRARNGWIMGLTAASLAAFSQFEITYAGEARAYAFASLGASLTLAGALRIVSGTPVHPDGTASFSAAATLVLGMSISLWAHPLGLVSAGLAGLFLIGWWATIRRREGGTFLRLALMAGLVIFLCWPHFVNTAAQLARDYSAFWIKAPSAYDLFAITFRATGLPGVPFGVPAEALVTAIVMAAGLAGLFRLGAKTTPAAALLPVCLAAGYWVVVVAYTYLSQPVLLDRTLIYIHPPAVLIAAAAPWALGRRQRTMATGLACLALVASVGPNDLHPGGQRLYGKVAEQIAERDPNAPVIALSGDAEVLLTYYEARLGVDFDIRTIPEPFPPRKNGLPDLISPADISVEDITRTVERVEEAPVVWVLARKSRKEVEILREALRRSGRVEEAIFEVTPGRNETTFLRYEMPDATVAVIDP
jgi:mannosyltransferase